jgi:hypothetical protein
MSEGQTCVKNLAIETIDDELRDLENEIVEVTKELHGLKVAQSHFRIVRREMLERFSNEEEQ